MALPIFQRTVVNDNGDIIPSAQVEVRLESNGALATIYIDRDGVTPLSNPFFADSNGLARFYANPDEYRIDAVGNGQAIEWRYVVLIDSNDVSTIGANFAAVETAADNIAAIIDAPNQAASAATSATEAANSATEASDSADDAATSAASVNAANIVHAPGTGLANEAGTAYASDVTTSSTDTTAGRLLKVGDFGLGTGSAQISSDLNNTAKSWSMRNGFFETTGTTLNTPSGRSGVLQFGYSSSEYSQVAMGHSTNSMHFRNRFSSAANVWKPWQEIYHTGNILGTVSQSSGVPTGAIIERGSNANGEYVKYADGTMIAFTPYQTLEASSTGTKSATYLFPSAFSGTPTITIGRGGSNLIEANKVSSFAVMYGGNTPTLSTALNIQYYVSAATAYSRFTYVAIGRWY